MKKSTKKTIVLTFLIFCVMTISTPSVSYKALASPQTCATMGVSAPGYRDFCSGGKATLLQVLMKPTVEDFLFLLLVGFVINVATSVTLAMILIYLKNKMYVKS